MLPKRFMVRVCKIWDSDYPWDVRVEKICDSLTGAGHEVHLVCRNTKGRKRYEYSNGIHIHRLPTFRFLGELLSFPFFLNPIWLLYVFRVVRKYNVELILVRDLPLALTGILVGKATGLSCFIDMAEPYPEMLDSYRKIQRPPFRKRMINFLIRNASFAEIVEQTVCRLAAHIFPVSEEMKLNLIKKGVPASKITLLHNTPLKSKLSFIRNDTERKDALEIIYVGDLTEMRGIPLVIEAVDHLVNKLDEKFVFTIVGAGRYETELRRLVGDRKLEKYVLFSGFVPHHQLPDYLMKGDMGIIPHLKVSHNDLTLPNKVFDYMACGLPVVSGNLEPVKRILERTNSGMIFDYTNDSLIQTLLKLKDPHLRAKLGSNGCRAVKEVFNWERDFDAFLSVMNNKSSI